MISLDILFYVFIFIFALIGAIRGWAKEIVALFGTLLGLFSLTVLESYVPSFKSYILTGPASSQIQLKAIIFGGIVFCAYQTPNLRILGRGDRFKREGLRDVILGFILGAANGFMIFGTIWYFIHQGNYPFSYIIEPIASTPSGQAALGLIDMLPPAWLVTPYIYFAIGLASLFVLVVLI